MLFGPVCADTTARWRSGRMNRGTPERFCSRRHTDPETIINNTKNMNRKLGLPPSLHPNESSVECNWISKMEI